MKKNNKKGSKALNDVQRKLVCDNLSLAETLARQYAGLGNFVGVMTDDLLQEACLGLCEAALRYDASKGVCFRTFAFDWCRKYVMAAINSSPVIDEEDTVDALEVDIIDEEVELREHQIRRVSKLLKQLNSQERQVIMLLYGFVDAPLDFQQVAKRLGLSSLRVHQLYERAMGKMEFELAEQATKRS